MQESIIQLDHVSRRFGGRDVLKGIDLQVPAGTITGLVGPNGSGKTTLLKPPVFLINLHADPYSAQRRNVLIGRATEVLMSQFPEHLKILAGDFNLDIDIDKRRDLFSDDEYLDVETYNYIAQYLSDVTLNTGSTAEPDRRLDYIFADYKRLKVIHSGPWKGKRVADMDHDPVVADLQIEKNTLGLVF